MWLFLLFALKTQDFSLVWTMFTKVHGKFMHNTACSDSFHGQGLYGINWHCQHLPTGRTYYTYGVFTDLSLNIKASVLQDKNFILCFDSQVWLLRSYVCVKFSGAKPLSFRILLVHQGLGCFKFKLLSKTFFKSTKWSVNTFQKTNMNVSPVY